MGGRCLRHLTQHLGVGVLLGRSVSVACGPQNYGTRLLPHGHGNKDTTHRLMHAFKLSFNSIRRIAHVPLARRGSRVMHGARCDLEHRIPALSPALRSQAQRTGETGSDDT
jgi:hypothetical protein